MQKFVLIATVMVTGSAFASPNVLHTNTHTPTKLESVSSFPTGSYQLAAVCFLGSKDCVNDAGLGNSNEYELDSQNQCNKEGFNITSCPSGFAPSGICPFDNLYFQKCVTIDQICTLKNYVTSCEAGQVLDPLQSCDYDSKYQKCKCDPCTGYNYSYDEATDQGYEVDEICDSCSNIKYKRKINDCAGFIECDCSGEVGAKVCWSSSIRKFSSCKKCYVKTNAKVGDFLYSDMSTLPADEKLTNSDVLAGVVAIGVVFDAHNRYAVALASHKYSLWQETTPVDIPDLPNIIQCDANGYNCETVLENDMDGRANTQAILAFGKEKNISYPAAEYCNNYTTKGTTAGQWFLPSIAELDILAQNEKEVRYALSRYHGNYGKICPSSTGCYNIFLSGLWSSSEYGVSAVAYKKETYPFATSFEAKDSRGSYNTILYHSVVAVIQF